MWSRVPGQVVGLLSESSGFRPGASDGFSWG